MIENIRLSFQGIWSHKMRSFLTMLGIIIGIASIISIVSTIKGTNEQIKKNLIGSGTNTVQIQLYQGDYQYEMLYNGLPDGIPVRDETTMEKIKSVKNVEDAAFYTSRSDYNNSVYYGNNGISGSQVFGVDNSYFTTNGLVLKSGRTFVDSDFTDFHAAAIIDADTADSLFDGENPIGKTIEISSIPFTVVGIVDEDSKFEPVINSIDEYYTYYSNSSASRIFVPSSMWPALYSFDEPQNVAIRVSNTEAMTDAGKAVAEIMNTNVTNSEIKYQAQDLQRQVYVDGRPKTDSQTLLYSIDALHTAINRGCLVQFRYKGSSAVRTVSPWQLAWENGCYYLIAYQDEKAPPVRHYRVDRMMDLTVLDSPRSPLPRDFDLGRYVRKIFDMYGGASVTVRLRLHRSLINPAMDRFGSDAHIRPDGPDHVALTAPVEAGPTFYLSLIHISEPTRP